MAVLDKLSQSLREKLTQELAEMAGEKETLEKVAGLSREEAKELLLQVTERQLADQLARRIKEAREEIKAKVDQEVREILVDAMQHGVTDQVAEYTVSTVVLPDEDIKGRIIGREGRNIRAFEQATGVEIELDESNALHLSSFDPVRREVARLALQKLMGHTNISMTAKYTRSLKSENMSDEIGKISI